MSKVSALRWQPLHLLLALAGVCAAPQRSFVLDLTPETLEPAIAKYDVIMVEFFAPWCGHCKRLAPEYEKAAQILNSEVPRVKLAKIDADKYRPVMSKYDINGYPTLRLYTNGIPTDTDYDEDRSAEAIVLFVKQHLIPPVSSISESELPAFVTSMSDTPIFIGFGMEPTVVEDLAKKHRRKARFAVIKSISEKVMRDFDFDKTPALVSLHPKFDEQGVYYGPFEGSDLEEFVHQNLLPLVSPVDDPDSVLRLKVDKRPIVIGVVASTTDDLSRSFIKKLKAAVPANRAFVFAYVEATKWPAFVQPFGIGKASLLPSLVIWNGESEFSISDDLEAFLRPDAEAQITKFLNDFKDNKVERRSLVEPSFLQKARKIVFGFPTLFLVCMIIIVVYMMQSFSGGHVKVDGNYTDERGRRTDLEGDIMGDRGGMNDNVEPLHFGRKNEKSD